MSRSVERFTAGSRGTLWGYGQGEWVRYSDYERLQSQLEQLRAENERLTKDNADLVAANLGNLLSEIKERLTLEEGEEFESLLMAATRGWVDEVTERTAVDRGLLEAFKDMPKKKRRH